MKTVLWTVFIGGTLAGGSPNKKPATKSPGAERSEAQKAPPHRGGAGEGEARKGASRSRFCCQSHFATKSAGLLVLLDKTPHLLSREES